MIIRKILEQYGKDNPEELKELLRKLYQSGFEDGFKEGQEKLLAEMRIEKEPCDDAISRSSVMNLIENYNSDALGTVFIDFRHGIKFADAVNELPVVKPERKRGKWLTDNGYVGYWICSGCRKPYPNDTPFCPWCGIEMEE